MSLKAETENNKYLKVKTNAFMQKLKETYVDIVVMCVKDDPGNLRVGFQSWGPDHVIIYLVGGKNQGSFWINNVGFKTDVSNNGSIEFSNLNKEFSDFCIIVDKLLADYNKN